MSDKGFFVFNRGVLSVFLVMSVYASGFAAAMFVLPLMAEKVFTDVYMVGFMIGLSGLTSMLSAIPFGGMCDRFGRTKILRLGFFLMFFTALILRYAVNPILYLFLMVVGGLGNAAVVTSGRSFVMDISTAGNSAKYFSVYTVAMGVGLAIGPVVSNLFLGSGDFWSGVYNVSVFSMMMCGISFVLVSLLKEKRDSGVVHPKFSTLLRSSLSDFRTFGSLGVSILLITLLLSCIDRMTWTLEPLYYNIIDSKYLVGLILSMFILPSLVFEVPCGFLADRFGKFRVLIPGLILTGLSLMAFGLTFNPWIMLFSAFFSALGFSLVWPSLSGLLTDLSCDCRRGGVVGVWSFSEDLGFTLGPLIGGFAAYFLHSISAPFLLLGSLLVVVALVTGIYNRGVSK